MLVGLVSEKKKKVSSYLEWCSSSSGQQRSNFPEGFYLETFEIPSILGMLLTH